MKVYEGKSGIKVRILAHSISQAGKTLLTYEIEYPRIIHSEVMTHRMLSRNAASSRAIPFAKMMEQLTAEPVRFGANVSGMQDNGEHSGKVIWENYRTGWDMCESPEVAWEYAKQNAMQMSKAFSDAGYHKQVFNRLTEPFQMIKVVVTATEWDNFFWLRNDVAADPTLHELARLMFEARSESVPQILKPGQWHLPYVDYMQEVVDQDEDDSNILGDMQYYVGDVVTGEGFELISIEDAIKVSCARCAAVSFRNVDYDVEKSRQVYERLVGDQRKHASAFEHCATPMKETHYQGGDVSVWTNYQGSPSTWQEGISHMDRNRNLWSGNLNGWIQYRKLIPGENYKAND